MVCQVNAILLLLELAQLDTIFGGLSMLIKHISLHVVNMPLVSLLFLINAEP